MEERLARKWLFTGLLVVSCLCSVEVGAQDASAALDCQRVRVWSAELGIRSEPGRVIRIRTDSLDIDFVSRDKLAVSMHSIERLERSLGPRARGEGAQRGILRGTLVGIAIGGAGSLWANAQYGAGCSDACGLWPFLLGGSIVSGAGVGALIGAVSPGEQWERIQLPQQR